MDEQPEFGFRRNSAGQHAIGRRLEHEPIRLVLTEREVEHEAEPTIDDLRDELVSVYGTDFGLRSAAWISRFTDMSRQAASYRSGRGLRRAWMPGASARQGTDRRTRSTPRSFSSSNVRSAVRSPR